MRQVHIARGKNTDIPLAAACFNTVDGTCQLGASDPRAVAQGWTLAL